MNYNYNNSYNYNYICSTTSPNNNSNHRSRNNEGREQDTQQHQHPQPHQQPMQAALRTASLSSSSNASSSTSTSQDESRNNVVNLFTAFLLSIGSCQDSSCCCPPGWEHKNYDKHASAATLTPATAAVGAAGAGGTTTATASIITTTGPAAATMSSSWSGEFLLPGIQLPVAAAGHSCADLRQTSQLVMPTVASGDVVEVDAEGGVLECGKRCWRRERIRREGPSHASAASLAQVNPISTSNSTSISTSPATTIDGASGAGAVVPTTAHNSQTTTKTTARGTTGAALPHDEENENDECRCFNYNGDISLDRRGEAAELSGITWLMFLWQHLLPGKRKQHPQTHPRPHPHPRIQLPSGDDNENSKEQELRHDVDKKLAGTTANAALGHVRQRLGRSTRW
ncbi:GM11028 [Drosophila sechellia]|uniref:GM11028 n=1 Tax=Drosophila sechellia TaxID=7238 RepID=B4I3I5_DROSE|nr:GM11028 [Drosophila sechellia]